MAAWSCCAEQDIAVGPRSWSPSSNDIAQRRRVFGGAQLVARPCFKLHLRGLIRNLHRSLALYIAGLRGKADREGCTLAITREAGNAQ